MLRQRGSRLPTALITGSVSPDIMRQAAALGVMRVLEKPLADDALLCFVACAASRGFLAALTFRPRGVGLRPARQCRHGHPRVTRGDGGP